MPRIIFKKLNVKEQEQVFAGEVDDSRLNNVVAIESEGNVIPNLGKSTGTITCMLSSTGQGGGGGGDMN